MANTTSTSLAGLFSDIVAQARFTAEQGSLLQGIVKTYDISNTSGKIIQVPKYGKVTATALTEGTDQTAVAASMTPVDVTVAGVGAVVNVTDIATFGGQGDVITELGTVLGNAIAVKMDKDVIDLFDGFSNSVGTATTALDVSLLLQAIANVRNNAYTGRLACVLNPLQARHLKADLLSGSPFANDVANEAMKTGFVGHIAGCDVYEHNEIAISSNSAKGAVFAPEAIALAMKRDFTLEQERNASLRSTELVATAFYGVAELEDGAGCEILTKTN